MPLCSCESLWPQSQHVTDRLLLAQMMAGVWQVEFSFLHSQIKAHPCTSLLIPNGVALHFTPAVCALLLQQFRLIFVSSKYQSNAPVLPESKGLKQLSLQESPVTSPAAPAWTWPM